MSVLLKKPVFSHVSQKELVEQLEAKKRCRHKLPTWFNTSTIYYPNKLNIEQTSSELTAEYKARLVRGDSLLDMTGGFGVDSFYFSKKIASVVHSELDKDLSQIAAHNFETLGVKNCSFVAKNGIDVLKDKGQRFDWVYVDPSRRHNVKGKVFRLEDCEPNIPEHLDLIFEHTDSVLIKTSPLLDLSLATNTLKNVSEIHVIAVQNEVKEVLFMLKRGYEDPIAIKTVNLKKEREDHFGFLWNQEKTTKVVHGLPETYLYEPNAAILKAGGFNSVGKRFGLKKLAPHSHLYTSKNQMGFPGRVFLIESVLPYQKKAMKSLVGTKANIATRNFPETVAQIRKKYKILDGGDRYLFFTADMNGNRIAINCTKE